MVSKKQKTEKRSIAQYIVCYGMLLLGFGLLFSLIWNVGRRGWGKKSNVKGGGNNGLPKIGENVEYQPDLFPEELRIDNGTFGSQTRVSLFTNCDQTVVAGWRNAESFISLDGRRIDVDLGIMGNVFTFPELGVGSYGGFKDRETIIFGGETYDSHFP